MQSAEGTILGDDIYCHEPFCRELQALGLDFILVCKPDSHPVTYEWVEDLQRNGAVGTVTRTRWTGKRRETDTYRYAEAVPLRDADARHSNQKRARSYRSRRPSAPPLDVDHASRPR